MSEEGYVDYFAILGLDRTAKPGEVRKNYKHLMKDLVMEIARVRITDERRDHYLLEMAKLNAAFFLLRDNAVREQYTADRDELIPLEDEWRTAVETDPAEAEAIRRVFEPKLRQFLSRYVEEATLTAGRDKECVEASNWDVAHERYASRILRHYRHTLYQQILARLPFWEVTQPRIDWDERARVVAAIIEENA